MNSVKMSYFLIFKHFSIKILTGFNSIKYEKLFSLE